MKCDVGHVNSAGFQATPRCTAVCDSVRGLTTPDGRSYDSTRPRRAHMSARGGGISRVRFSYVFIACFFYSQFLLPWRLDLGHCPDFLIVFVSYLFHTLGLFREFCWMVQQC